MHSVRNGRSNSWSPVLSVMLLMILGCSSFEPFELSPQPGLSVRVTNLRYLKSRKRVIGMVEIKNRADHFVRVSNKELFLYCNGDSARAYMKMPGEWQIDKGLINVVSGKTLTYQAYWPIQWVSDTCTVDMKYLKVIERD
ncbi:MAG: hypothetical protein ACLFSB_01270 [Chitinispirillaceae bacterium]